MPELADPECAGPEAAVLPAPEAPLPPPEPELLGDEFPDAELVEAEFPPVEFDVPEVEPPEFEFDPPRLLKDSNSSRNAWVLPMNVVIPFIVSLVSDKMSIASLLKPVKEPVMEVNGRFPPESEPEPDPAHEPSSAMLPEDGSKASPGW